MLCTVCNEREATVHLCQVVDGNEIELDLCEVCGKPALEFAQKAQAGSEASSQVDDLETVLSGIVTRDSRYAKDAYRFVVDASGKAFEKHFEVGEFISLIHLSAAELLEAFRRRAIDTFATDAKAILNSWGVRRCEDFGEIVFNLIEAGVLTKRPEETREYFRGGYDFDSAFPGDSAT